MLDILKRGTVQISNFTWEYHGDTDDSTIFYITPQPAWMTANELPKIQLVQYNTSDPLNGSGYCTLQVQLSVPDEAVMAVTSDINTRFGVKPRFLTLPFQPGTIVEITYPDGQGGTTGQQVAGSDFGSNGAIFQLGLDADQMKTFKEVLNKKGGSPFEVQYSIIVPAMMPSVEMELTFDSKTALDYQVTSHEHTHWASSSSYTYDISKQLASSNASTVHVKKINPNVPQEVVDKLKTWGQSVIMDLVAKQVAAAIALENNASGTQSFSVSQISSFSEKYEEDQTILWRLQPQTVLPSFGDLGLTIQQIASLEPVVDKRKFVAQVTPKCNFVGSEKSLNPAIAPGTGPYMTDAQELQSLQVTIKYPTLDDKPERTHTFTDSTPFTWEADWDDMAGGVYSLEYMAVYKDPKQPSVSGEVQGIEASAYTITLELIGILNVTFDASIFFANKKVSTVVKEIIVDFVFNIPQAPPVLERFTLDSTNATHNITSLSAAPINTDYVYTVTYIFKDDAKANPYTSDAKQQNGQWIYLNQPDLVQSVSVVVDMDNVYKAEVNVYYEGEPYFPEIPASKVLPRPTQESPIQLVFPEDSTATDQPRPRFQLQTISLPAYSADSAKGENKASPTEQDLYLFANSKLSPLMIHASLITSDMDQYDFGPYLFNPQSVVFFSMSAAKTFAMITADPGIVDWTNLTCINVRIKAVRYIPSTSTGTLLDGVEEGTKATYAKNIAVQAMTLDTTKEHSYAVHFPLTSLPMNFTEMEFDWVAEYVYKDGMKLAQGTQQGTLVALPKAATTAPPASAAKGVRQWKPNGAVLAY
ncbi:hypothetical protein [Hymenobacter negativus]|uniref:Uncharacterized protein n=1 Tax=Hymenobacter negativus TaxID=2795026 RepID=A0ABS3QL03_9BACT|nr:hypothetical protein [Hymenobacter negativus]MBO2011922.1 hypothetical protein [Hymenobacter negativus]